MNILIKIKQSIPNSITSLNLLSGCISIILAFEGNLVYAAYLIGIAAIFDFFDGFAARILKAYSDIGKQLDSLADVISFGLAPSVILFKLLQKTLQVENISIENIDIISLLILLSSFLIAIFSALRLAKFNIDTRQTNSFIGLPTPANAILLASLPIIITHHELLNDIILNKYFLLLLIVVQSFLLVSEIPMFSLKFKDLKFSNNKFQYILLLIALLLIVFYNFAAIPIIIFLYIVLSIINNLIINKNR